MPPKVTKEIEIYFERRCQRRIKDQVLNNLNTCENKDKCNIKPKEKVAHKCIHHLRQVSVCLWVRGEGDEEERKTNSRTEETRKRRQSMYNV